MVKKPSVGRGLVLWATALTLYFVPLLIPEWVPWVGSSRIFAFYWFSVVGVVAIMALTVPVGIAAVLLARLQGNPGRRRLRVLVLYPSTCLVVFSLVFVAVRLVQRGLPSGSRVMAFDGSSWRDETSWRFTEGDITPRQKMLGDVVETVLPNGTRAQIEARLGPSTETRHFESTGRDLIYKTGPERGALGIDAEWLLIWLDEAGTFDRYEVVAD